MNTRMISKRLTLMVLLLMAGLSHAMAQAISMNDFTLSPGESKTVTIDLSQAGVDIYGLQTDITLSNGLSLDGDPIAVERTIEQFPIVVTPVVNADSVVVEVDSTVVWEMNGYTPELSFRRLNSGAIRIVMLSMDGGKFKSDATSVVTLAIKASENFYGGTIRLSNTRLTTSSNGDEMTVANYTVKVSSTAQPVIDDNVWSIPEPQGLEFTDPTFDDDTRYYLYNPDAKMFFASGNDWNTRASVASFGYEVWFYSSFEEDAFEGSYEFWNNVQHPNRTLFDKMMFTDDGGSTWVDRASQSNYSWSIVKVGDFYRFQNVALIADLPEYDGKYFGWKGDYADTRLYMITPEEGFVDWKFVTAESYENFRNSEWYDIYINGVEAYNLAQQLKALLDEADEIGAEVAAEKTVYENTQSTIDEINNAIESVRKAIEDRQQEIINGDYDNASVANPVDVTAKFLVNFDFKNNDYLTGWNGTTFGYYSAMENVEHYNKIYNTYQTISGMKPGVYAVGVNAFYRAGNAEPAYWNWKADNADSKLAKLYARTSKGYHEVSIVSPFLGAPNDYDGPGSVSAVEDDETGELLVIPNNMLAAEYFMHELGLYKNKVFVSIASEEDYLQLGVTKGTTIQGDWSLFDDFSLTYYGAGVDAYTLYLEESLKSYETPAIEEGTLYTEQYLTNYNTLIGQNYDVSSIDEINQILINIDVAQFELTRNIDLWKQWVKAVNDAEPFVEKYFYLHNLGVEIVGDLSDYISEAHDIMEEDTHAQTNEELESAIEQIDEWKRIISEAAAANLQDGDDVTDFIINPGFDDDADINSGLAEGWTIEHTNGGVVTRGPLGQSNKEMMESALGKMNYCFESWHCHKWDIWQELKGLPVGMYELQVQGYVRCEMSGYYRGDDINPDYPSPVHLYMNNAMSKFPSVYSECPADLGHEFTTVESWTTETVNGNLYPNSMGGAAQCFDWGMYKTTAYGLIAKEGDTFRIGVKMDANQDWWCIFDNFKLTYKAPTVEIVRPVLEEAMQTINTDQPMGKEWFEQAEAAMNAANEALAAADGPAMFKALSDIYDLQAGVATSVALFTQLAKANEELAEAIWESENEDAKSEAIDLNELIINGIDNHEFEDSDVEGLLAEIDAMKTKLRIPSGDNASDDNPVDFTSVIVNPSFEDELNGWSGTQPNLNYNWQNAEFFSKNFDFYQDIQGLPEGTYQVFLNGYYRAGSAMDDYSSYIQDPKADSHAFIYAQNGAGEVSSKAMARLASEAYMDYIWDNSNYTFAAEPDDYGYGPFVCNNMEAAMWEFDEGKYWNEGPVVKVGEDGMLRIGLMKDYNMAYDWTMFDNWQLVYYGKNSNKQNDEDVLLGDANNDGQVSMGDVVTIVNYVLGKELTAFNSKNADVNGSGDITMGDVVCVVNIVLGKTNATTRSRSLMSEAIGVLNVQEQQKGIMSISLDNTADYAAFQMDVTLPADMSIADADFSDRATTSHQLSYNRLSNGKVRIIGWSAQNTSLKGNSGELLHFSLQSKDAQETSGLLTVDNVLFTTVDGTEQKLASVEAFGQTTGIVGIAVEADVQRGYDLQGRRMAIDKKGLYIINGRKNVVK